MSYKILFVDDEKTARETFKYFFEVRGYEVILANDGNEGINLFQNSKFDIVITDIIMPDKDGLEFIRELKEKEPLQNIIAISGGGHSDPTVYLESAKTLGAKAIFTKPIDLKQLLKDVEKLLAE